MRTDFEAYFVQFLEEFAYIKNDSSIDVMIDVETNKLDNNAQNPDDFRKLEIINNLKEAKRRYAERDNQEIHYGDSQADSKYRKHGRLLIYTF